MRKSIAVFGLLAVMLLCGCGGKVKNQAYIDEQIAKGAPQEDIDALIKYEKKNTSQPDGGYVDITGRTVGELAEDMGITLEEYIAQYDLPRNLPSLVSETEVNYTIPVKRMAEIYGMKFEELKNMYNLPDSVDENTTWGEAIGYAKVEDMIGDGNNVEKFKETFKLPDSVTGDTLWSEVREQVDEVKRENRLSEEK